MNKSIFYLSQVVGVWEKVEKNELKWMKSMNCYREVPVAAKSDW